MKYSNYCLLPREELSIIAHDEFIETKVFEEEATIPFASNLDYAQFFDLECKKVMELCHSMLNKHGPGTFVVGSYIDLAKDSNVIRATLTVHKIRQDNHFAKRA